MATEKKNANTMTMIIKRLSKIFKRTQLKANRRHVLLGYTELTVSTTNSNDPT